MKNGKLSVEQKRVLDNKIDNCISWLEDRAKAKTIDDYDELLSNAMDVLRDIIHWDVECIMMELEEENK